MSEQKDDLPILTSSEALDLMMEEKDIPPPPPLRRQDHNTMYEHLLTLEQLDKFCVISDNIVLGAYDTLQDAILARQSKDPHAFLYIPKSYGTDCGQTLTIEEFDMTEDQYIDHRLYAKHTYEEEVTMDELKRRGWHFRKTDLDECQSTNPNQKCHLHIDNGQVVLLKYTLNKSKEADEQISWSFRDLCETVMKKRKDEKNKPALSTKPI